MVTLVCSWQSGGRSWFNLAWLPEDFDHSILWAVVEACAKTLQGRQWKRGCDELDGALRVV